MTSSIVKASNSAEKIIIKNSPLILTTIGIAAMWVGTVMVAKAAPKAKEALEESRKERSEDISKPKEILEDVKAVTPLYLPAGIVLASATTCFICSYKISADRLAKYAGALILTEAKAAEYQQKVIEKIGEKKEKEIRDEIVKDHIDEHSNEQEKYTIDEILMDGKQLFWDDFTKHYFRCSYQELYDAKEHINIALDIDASHGCRETSVNDWLEMFDDLREYRDSKWDDWGWLPGSELTYDTVPHLCKDGLTSCTAVVISPINFCDARGY